jgi:hypothetical protein
LNSDLASLFSLDLQYESLAFIEAFFALDQQYEMGLAFIEDLSESMVMSDAADSRAEFLGDLVDAATMTDTDDFIREMFGDLVDGMTMSDLVSVLAEFTADLTDEMTINEILDQQGEVFDAWVVNTETGAVSRYDWLPFTSLTEFNGRYFGTTAEGLYELAGDTDDGGHINAFVLSGVDDLDIPGDKRVIRGYIGLKTSGEMLLKTIVGDNVTRIYRLVSSSNAMHQRRLPLGKGVDSVYWQFALENIDGADFETDVIKLLPVVLKRRFR